MLLMYPIAVELKLYIYGDATRFVSCAESAHTPHATERFVRENKEQKRRVSRERPEMKKKQGILEYTCYLKCVLSFTAYRGGRERLYQRRTSSS